MSRRTSLADVRRSLADRRQSSTSERRSSIINLPSFSLVFIGDSPMGKWLEEGINVWESKYEPLDAANFGAYENSTQHVIDKLQNNREINFDSTKVVVLMIGSTDLMHKLKPSVVHEQIQKIIQLLQANKSGIKILVLSILPNHDCTPEVCASIEGANKLIATVENGYTVRFLDLWPHFVPLEKKNELFLKDGFHLTTSGYELWSQVMDETLRSMINS